MISYASESVASFFAEIGIDLRIPGTESELVIDRFDHWSDLSHPLDRATLCQCAIPDPVE